MIYMQPNTDTDLGGANSSNEYAPSQKAAKVYIDDSLNAKENVTNKETELTDSSTNYPASSAVKYYIDSRLVPKSVSILGPANVYKNAGTAIYYKFVTDPVYASSYTVESVTGTNSVVITSITHAGFTANFNPVTAGNNVTFTATIKIPDNKTLTITKTVGVIAKLNGVGIQDLSRVIYTSEEWGVCSKIPGDIRGIAVGDSTNSLCLWKNQTNNISWSSNTSIQISEGGYPITTTDATNASKNYTGKLNTDAILLAVSKGTIKDAPAARWARDFGSEWYLPAAGELVMINNNKNNISDYSDFLSGNLKNMFLNSKYHIWSSTQNNASRGWGYNNGIMFSAKNYTNNDYYVLARIAL